MQQHRTVTGRGHHMDDDTDVQKAESGRLQSLFEYLADLRRESLSKVDEVLKKVVPNKKTEG